jgi:predicted NBD/HSP70 family sugar kinase
MPGVKTALLNDTAAALEAARADFQPTATAALVMVGTAIGAAFQMDGAIAKGAKGWAGELGYMPVRSPTGGVQHLDSVSGGAASLRQSGLSAPELSARLADGDESVRALVGEAGRALGLALATLVNLLNPELIVLGGGTLAYIGYVEAALAEAEVWSFPALWQCCRIVVSPHGERLVALGAATAATLAT